MRGLRAVRMSAKPWALAPSTRMVPSRASVLTHAAIVSGFGRIDGEKFMIIGHRKGRDTKAKLRCNFGCAHPEGYRKALHKMKMAETFGNLLYGLHIKDFVFDQAGKPADVVVGTGNLDLVALNDTLKGIAFEGFAALEYEADVDNPVGPVTQCVQAVIEQMKG